MNLDKNTMPNGDDPERLTRTELIAEFLRLRAGVTRQGQNFPHTDGAKLDLTETPASEAALRERHELFRTILHTIEAAFAIVEVKFDEDDYPVDYRFLEANPAFERRLASICEASG